MKFLLFYTSISSEKKVHWQTIGKVQFSSQKICKSVPYLGGIGRRDYTQKIIGTAVNLVTVQCTYFSLLVFSISAGPLKLSHKMQISFLLVFFLLDFSDF